MKRPPRYRPAAKERALKRFESQWSIKLPVDLREIYLITDGLDIFDMDISILSLHEAAAMVDGFWQTHWVKQWAIVPFTSGSDPFCVACQQPLLGYVVRIHHDRYGGPLQLMFRSVTNLMRAIFTNYSSSIDELGSEFDRDDRTEHDRATGRDVLKQAKQWTGDARDMAIAMGTQLLGPDDVDELRIVLEGSECKGLGRWLVRQRLNQMATVAAQQILDADQRRFDKFVSDCLSELKNNGLNPVIESEDVIQIGSKSFSLTHIYESYRETGSFEDALNNILGRIRKN